MRHRGFTNHAVMGATFLAGAWFAVYLPDLTPAIRLGGGSMWLALGAGFIGIVLCPVLIFVLEGDEGFGFIGLMAALLFGWLSAKGAGYLGAAPEIVERARLCGAALGPLSLLALFAWRVWALNRRRTAG